MATRREFLVVLSGAPPILAALEQEGAARIGGAPLSDALANVVRAQSGSYLTPDEMKRVSSDFNDYIPALDKFRAFKLTNSDEPDLTFAAVTKRWL